MTSTATLKLVEAADGRKQRLDVQHRAALAVLRDLARVLPPMDAGMVDVLADSMLTQGYFAHEPILRYQVPGGPEVTLSGRHREAAAAKAGVEPAVAHFGGDPVEAVATVMASVLQHRYLDINQRLAVKKALDAAGYDWEQITRDRGLRVTRDQINEALMEQARQAKPLNHRAIARQLGMEFSRLRVDRACKVLVANGSMDHCPHRFTETGAEARGAKPRPPAPPAPEPPAPPVPEPREPEEILPAPAPPVPVPPAPEPERPAPAPAPQVQLPLADEETLALDQEIRRRLLAGQPTRFRELAGQFGVGASLVQNRIQWNQGFLAARQASPACTHSCPAHCPEG